MRVSQWAYLGLTRLGVRAEVARAVLPTTCLKTELDVTANFREWLHILKLRTDAAHPDMSDRKHDWEGAFYDIALTCIRGIQMNWLPIFMLQPTRTPLAKQLSEDVVPVV